MRSNEKYIETNMRITRSRPQPGEVFKSYENLSASRVWSTASKAHVILLDSLECGREWKRVIARNREQEIDS